jgi:hypothetical protein
MAMAEHTVLTTFGEIAKRAEQDKMLFQVFFMFFTISMKKFQGNGRRNRVSMRRSVTEGL